MIDFIRLPAGSGALVFLPRGNAGSRCVFKILVGFCWGFGVRTCSSQPFLHCLHFEVVKNIHQRLLPLVVFRKQAPKLSPCTLSHRGAPGVPAVPAFPSSLFCGGLVILLFHRQGVWPVKAHASRLCRLQLEDSKQRSS